MHTVGIIHQSCKPLIPCCTPLRAKQMTANQLRDAEREPIRDEASSISVAHGMPTAQALEDVRRFYAPFNARLAELLGDHQFLWNSERAHGLAKMGLSTTPSYHIRQPLRGTGGLS